MSQPDDHFQISPATQVAPREPKSVVWPLILSVAMIHLLISGGLIYLGTYTTFDRQSFETLLMSAVAGQISCLAAWGCCGPGAWSVCVPGALTGTVLVWFGLNLSVMRGTTDGNLTAISAVLVGGQFLPAILGISLWRMFDSGRFGWDAAKPTEEEAGVRFSLLHLMGWTAIVAVLCTLARRALWDSGGDIGSAMDRLLPIAGFALLSAGHAICQVIGCSAVLPRPVAWAVCFLSPVLIYALRLSVVALGWASNIGFSSFADSLGQLSVFKAIQVAEIWITFGLLYAGGLRWQPIESRSSQQEVCGEGV